MTEIYTAIMDAYRRVEARKAAERKIALAMLAQDQRDRKKYLRRFDG